MVGGRGSSAVSDGRIQTGRTGRGGSRQHAPPKLPTQREMLVGPRRKVYEGVEEADVAGYFITLYVN